MADRARVLLDMPPDCDRDLAVRLATLALHFAAQFIDRPSGQRHCVIYRVGRWGDAAVWWTAARSVSARLLPAKESGDE